MSRVLVLTWAGAGNQVPAAALVQELAARGHDVTVAGYASQRDRFPAAGFGLLARADLAYRRATAARPDVMQALVDGVWAAPEHLDDVAGLPAADAAVVDCLLFGALAAFEAGAGPVPAARTGVLVHSPPGAILPPGGGLDALALDAVAAVRARAGLPRPACLQDTWRPFPTLVTSVPELDPGPAPPPGRFVGPLAERLPPSGRPLPWRAGDPRPLAVVSFSTGPAWDQTARLRRTLAALAPGHRVVALTGPFPVDPVGDAVVLPFLPHDEVLPAASVTVTHAGHGTVAASLAHGVPLVCLPNPAADQPALAARVAELGAGIALDGETAGPAEIAAAVATVTRDGRYAARARALAASIAAAPGPAGCADLVEELAGRRPAAG